MLSFKSFLLEMYKNLTAGELLKPGREGRGSTVADKIKDGDPFLLHKGGTVVIKKDDELLSTFTKALNDRDNKTLNNIEFTGTDGKTYQLKDFAKSPEFGGKGAGSGTRAEDEALADLKKKLQKILEEDQVPFIYVKIGKKTEKVSSIESTPGTPKSDFHMMDENGKEVFWISHKKGSKANDFQQYGGMPELQFTKSKDMMSFVEDVKEQIGEGRFPMKTAFARKVKDKKIIMMTLFGKEYRSGRASSRQNIDVLFQGSMNFVKAGSKESIPVYKMTSNHTMTHGEFPRGEYEAYYYVRPEQAKKQFGVPGGRFFIVAKGTALKNRNTKEI